jgi:hypothetical protein
MSEQLKQCSGCGCAARPVRLDLEMKMFYVACKNMECGIMAYGNTQGEAVQLWNHRTPGPATKAMLEWANNDANVWKDDPIFQAFIDEWRT